MELSPFEQIINTQINQIKDELKIKNVLINKYYSWLRNPKTKQKLQIDFLLEFIVNDCQIFIGIEVQGSQHYRFNETFHKTKDDLTEQKYRDKIKRELCNKRKVFLIPIPYFKIKEDFDLKTFLITKITNFKCSTSKFRKKKRLLIEHFAEKPKTDFITLSAWVDFLKC